MTIIDRDPDTQATHAADSLNLLGFRTEFYLHDLTVLAQANRLGFQIAGFNDQGQLILQGIDVGKDGLGETPIDLRRYAGSARMDNDHEYGGICSGRAAGATYLQVRTSDGHLSDSETAGFDLDSAAKLRGRFLVPRLRETPLTGAQVSDPDS